MRLKYRNNKKIMSHREQIFKEVSEDIEKIKDMSPSEDVEVVISKDDTYNRMTRRRRIEYIITCIMPSDEFLS